MTNKTVDEFCLEYRISRAKYYRMQRAGTGPRELRVERSVLITDDARKEWQAKLEAEQSQPKQGEKQVRSVRIRKSPRNTL